MLKSILGTLVLGFALTGTSAFAADTAGSQSSGKMGDKMGSMNDHMMMPAGPCMADMKKLCPTAKGHESMECMKSHEADLSAGCKSQMEAMKSKMREHMEAMNSACQSDIGNYCKTENGEGGWKVAHCLKENEAKLSATCKTALNSMHQMHQGGGMMMKGSHGNPNGMSTSPGGMNSSTGGGGTGGSAASSPNS